MFLVFASQQMQQVARNWFLYEITRSPLMLAMLGLATGLPMVMFSLLGGVLADRFSKKYIIMASIVGMAVSSLCVALIVVSGAAKNSVVATLVLASVLQGTAQAFMLPTRQAMIPELVGKRLLMNAISLNSAFMNLTCITTPGIAGVLIAATGVGPIFFIMSGMVFASALIMFFLSKMPPAQRARRTNMVTDMGDTFRYLKTKPVLLNLMIFAFASVAFGLPFQLMLPIFTTDILKVGPQGLGLLLSLTGVGALAGSVVVASLGDFRRKGLQVLILMVVWGLTIIAFTAIPVYAVALALMVPMGISSTARATVNQTLLQSNIDDHMRARVMGIYMMEVGLQPLGSVPMGALAEVVGAQIAVGAAGAVVALVAAWGLLFRPIIRNMP